MNYTNGGKILIIEDDNVLAGLIFKVLSQNGYIARHCVDSNDALQTLGLMQDIDENKTFLPDMILMDIGLPGLNGFELINLLKKNNPYFQKIPYILLSGQYIEKQDIVRGLENGAVDYIAKPFDMDILLLKVRNMFKHYKSIKKVARADTSREILDIKDTAAYLQLTEKTVYSLVKNGGLPALKIGGQWRLSKKNINQLFS